MSFRRTLYPSVTHVIFLFSCVDYHIYNNNWTRKKIKTCSIYINPDACTLKRQKYLNLFFDRIIINFRTFEKNDFLFFFTYSVILDYQEYILKNAKIARDFLNFELTVPPAIIYLFMHICGILFYLHKYILLYIETF